MPEAQPAAAGGNRDPQQQAAGGINNLISFVVRIAVFWYLMKWFQGSSTKAPAGAPSKGVTLPLYQKGTEFDVYMYVNEQPGVNTFESWQPIWVEERVELAEEEHRTLHYTYSPSEVVKNNGSVYLHVLFARSGTVVDEELAIFEGLDHFWRTHSLNVYLPKRKEAEGVSLLSANKTDAATPAAPAKREIISYWKPNMTVAMVDHFQAYPTPQAIPPQLQPAFQFDMSGRYYPLVHFNEFWLLREKLIPLNNTVDTVHIDLVLSHESFWWWQLQLQMDQSFSMQVNTGMSADGDSDEFKRVLIEGNPYLLVLTFCVSLLHTVFDMLAFKNDIGFWKNNKSMEGLSARSIVINAGCQLVILLYLIDNETSFVVLLSSGIGTAIEFWKVTKAMDVSFDSKKFPFLILKDKASSSQKKTKEYDAEATRYLSYALYPLIFGYSIYSLYYQKHKSWYSWVLNTLVGSVYAFGFILMCPQLYLNYKLKSVAHLPWRQMTYKFLNTIIDDLFAFVIKMPLLHRLSVFRDDAIFLIYIYQRWIYRVDKTRVNEFGFSGEEAPKEGEAEAVEGAAAVEQLPAPDEQPAAAAAGGEPEGSARRRKGPQDAKEEEEASAAAPAAAAAAVKEYKKAK